MLLRPSQELVTADDLLVSPATRQQQRWADLVDLTQLVGWVDMWPKVRLLESWLLLLLLLLLLMVTSARKHNEAMLVFFLAELFLPRLTLFLWINKSGLIKVIERNISCMGNVREWLVGRVQVQFDCVGWPKFFCQLGHSVTPVICNSAVLPQLAFEATRVFVTFSVLIKSHTMWHNVWGATKLDPGCWVVNIGGRLQITSPCNASLATQSLLWLSG